jgi:hypothetical protein
MQCRHFAIGLTLLTMALFLAGSADAGEPLDLRGKLRPGLGARQAGEPGKPIDGLKLSLEVEQADLQLTPLNLRRARADTPHYGCKGTRLTLTFTNVGEQPIKLNRHDFEFARLHLVAEGPGKNSVWSRNMAPLMDRAVAAPQAGDFPTIAPGKSLTITPSGRFPGRLGSWQFKLRDPGEYTLKVVYLNRAMRAKVPKFMLGQWTGAVTSNVVKLRAWRPAIQSEVKDGLKFGVSAWSPKVAPGEIPQLRVALSNAGKKDLLVLPFLVPNATVFYEVTDPAGKKQRFRGPMMDWDVPDYDKAVRTLKPGESVGRVLGLGGFDFSKPGKYQVTVTYNWPNAKPPPGRLPKVWKRDPIWTGKLSVSFPIEVMKVDVVPAKPGAQGVMGTVVKLEGNFMPGPGPRPGARRTPLSTPVHVFRGLVEPFKKPDPDHPKLVKIVKADEKGQFKLALPPGVYTVVAEVDGKMYLNLFRMDPQTRRSVWGSVTVRPNKWTQMTIEETSGAAF